MSGFTLIELLVVILIIGVLAVIAIPSFLNQTSKADDASAKELARTAQSAAEVVATDHDGDYSLVTPTLLSANEPTIPIAAGRASAYLSAASGTTSGYTVITTAQPSGDSYRIVKAAGGSIARTCVAATASKPGGCVGGTW